MTSRPLRSALAGSCVVHAALLAIGLIVMREGLEPAAALVPGETPSVRLIWIPAPGAAGGGGGGGQQMPQPARRAEAPGRDRISAAFTPPPVIDERPATAEVEPVAAPLLDARSLASAATLRPGVIDERADTTTASQGPGRDGVAGSGDSRGSGVDSGPSLGPGRGRGAGPGSYGVGNGVTSPQLLRQVTPRYTTDAMRARLSGSVILDCVVQPDGSVGDIRIVRSLDPIHGLDAEAIKAASAWRFLPGRRLGEPVPVAIRIELMFNLR